MTAKGNTDNSDTVRVLSAAEAMRTAFSERQGAEIPVNLNSRQPFDDFPKYNSHVFKEVEVKYE